MKVLIIDDSIVMRRLHKKILMEHKIPEEDILEAEDGKTAIRISEKQNVGLFLLDWNMPNMDGIEFVQRIRKLDKYKNTPIIMITLKAEKYHVLEAVQSGVTNYVIKPIKENALWEKISKYFS